MIAGVLLSAVQALAPSGPVVVTGEVTEVLVIAGDVRVEGVVRGNVVVLLGDVALQPAAVVDGDVVVFGGNLLGPGRVQGRKLVVGGRGAPGVGSWAVVFLRWGMWLVGSFVLLLLAPLRVRKLAEEVKEAPLGCAVTGGWAVLCWVAVMVVLGAVTSGVVQVILWALLAVGLLLAKVFGMVGVFWMLGCEMRLFLPRPLRGEFPRTGMGALVLLLLGAVPLVGEGLWLVASLLGFGSLMRQALPAPALVPDSVP